MSPSIEQLHPANACCNLSNPDHTLVSEASVTKGFAPLKKKKIDKHTKQIVSYIYYVSG